MRNSKNKERCEKQSFTKHAGVCRTYSELQLAYAPQIEANPNIVEFRCNVPLPDFELTDGSYTTDFLCTTVTGDRGQKKYDTVIRDYSDSFLRTVIIESYLMQFVQIFF